MKTDLLLPLHPLTPDHSVLGDTLYQVSGSTSHTAWETSLGDGVSFLYSFRSVCLPSIEALDVWRIYSLSLVLLP